MDSLEQLYNNHGLRVISDMPEITRLQNVRRDCIIRSEPKKRWKNAGRSRLLHFVVVALRNHAKIMKS